MNRTLEGGESVTVAYRLEFNPNGCNHGTSWVSSMPTVAEEALGLSGTQRGSVGLAVSGKYTRGCSR